MKSLAIALLLTSASAWAACPIINRHYDCRPSAKLPHGLSIDVHSRLDRGSPHYFIDGPYPGLRDIIVDEAPHPVRIRSGSATLTGVYTARCDEKGRVNVYQSLKREDGAQFNGRDQFFVDGGAFVHLRLDGETNSLTDTGRLVCVPPVGEPEQN